MECVEVIKSLSTCSTNLIKLLQDSEAKLLLGNSISIKTFLQSFSKDKAGGFFYSVNKYPCTNNLCQCAFPITF